MLYEQPAFLQRVVNCWQAPGCKFLLTRKKEFPLERYDEINGYCRTLGHHIPFKYCRTLQNGLPCAKILNCFFERFPIQEFIDNHYSEQQKSQIFKIQEPKLNSILELIAQAKNRIA